MTIDARTGLILCEPVETDLGQHDVQMKVSDGDGGTNRYLPWI